MKTWGWGAVAQRTWVSLYTSRCRSTVKSGPGNRNNRKSRREERDVLVCRSGVHRDPCKDNAMPLSRIAFEVYHGHGAHRGCTWSRHMRALESLDCVRCVRDKGAHPPAARVLRRNRKARQEEGYIRMTLVVEMDVARKDKLPSD